MSAAAGRVGLDLGVLVGQHDLLDGAFRDAVAVHVYGVEDALGEGPPPRALAAATRALPEDGARRDLGNYGRGTRMSANRSGSRMMSVRLPKSSTRKMSCSFERARLRGWPWTRLSMLENSQ